MKEFIPAGMTTFVTLPAATLLSLAFTMFFDDPACLPPLPAQESQSEEPFYPRELERYSVERPPLRLFAGYAKTWAEKVAVKGAEVEEVCDGLCLWRIDLRNASRAVGHHFMSRIDGHRRRYRLRVETVGFLPRLYAVPGVNEDAALPPLPAHFHRNNGVFSAVFLVREKDDSFIPYEHVYGVTLITALRLTLHRRQRRNAYSLFLKLPLYEDMAPWNILVTGDSLTYIDYDTREQTFTQDVAKVYRLLEVLMNYKRTVEDFRMCGDAAENPVYNFQVVSDCVGSLFKGPCRDPLFPVPCGDGSCKTDYVACLRDIDAKEKQGTLQGRYMTPMNLYMKRECTVCFSISTAYTRGKTAVWRPPLRTIAGTLFRTALLS